ncbi:glycosyltransferase family 4 protein [Dyadobacter sandarakinus]|uniref:Glycosyltransferase family 4 protein n=1 Tax=Dyadobacter sandarakinus TaxID=2747268 RepID=A0ABX7I9J1_9BACT|nr:glycosyltransferase family 4 protein [Dyadobacter sandarakinus]QRR02769.1 glycosyltransferase family 4 protein [Dyadobacter sandarakinus]
MHILLIHQYFLQDGEGGGPRWNEMGRLWVQAGHQLTVITGDLHYMQESSARSECEHQYVNSDGIHVVCCGATAFWDKGFFGRLLGFFTFVGTSMHALRQLPDQFDLVLATSPPLSVALPGLAFCFLKKLPLVFEIRDLWPESAIAMGVVKNPLLIRLACMLEKYVLKKAALINVLTPAFRLNLIGKGISPEKIICVPNAADFGLADQVAETFNREQFRAQHGFCGRFVIVYAGAHGPANQLVQLADAAALLQHTSVLFVLIGDGRQKAALVNYCRDHCIANMVFLPPMSRPKVFRYILAANMGVAALAKKEIFKTIYSNKTFDYFSCKKPVLMIIDGISRQLAEEAGAGIYAEPEHAADIADKVRFCMQNPALLVQMGENGYDFARQHYNRTRLAETYLEHLENVVSSNEPKVRAGGFLNR